MNVGLIIVCVVVGALLLLYVTDSLVDRPGAPDESPVEMPSPSHPLHRSPYPEAETGAGGYSVIVAPSTAGDQRLLIKAGSEETVCTLSNYGERVATGRIEPYLVVLIQPHQLARLDRLQAGTYDITVETGQDWSNETRKFRLSTSRRRSQRPLRLFGQAEFTLYAYPVTGGDLPLGDV